MKLNFKKARIRKKHYYELLDNYKHYKDWMFINNDITNVEILSPDISTIKMMIQYDMKFVVKGFKSPLEYSIYNNIRFKHGFYHMMYASRCVGNNLIFQAINSLANNQPLPSQEEVCDAIEKNRLVNIKSDKEEKYIKERIKYKYLSEKYSVILHRKIQKLIKQNRVTILENII